jgi:cytochrome b561
LEVELRPTLLMIESLCSCARSRVGSTLAAISHLAFYVLVLGMGLSGVFAGGRRPMRPMLPMRSSPHLKNLPNHQRVLPAGKNSADSTFATFGKMYEW